MAGGVQERGLLEEQMKEHGRRVKQELEEQAAVA